MNMGHLVVLDREEIKRLPDGWIEVLVDSIMTPGGELPYKCIVDDEVYRLHTAEMGIGNRALYEPIPEDPY